MPAFVFRLIPPRPDFAMTLTDEERELMGAHAAHWQPYIDSGEMVVFGPVADGSGSWGLGVLQTDNPELVATHAATDPFATSGTGTIEVGSLLMGHVRGGGPPIA